VEKFEESIITRLRDDDDDDGVVVPEALESAAVQETSVEESMDESAKEVQSAGKEKDIEKSLKETAADHKLEAIEKSLKETAADHKLEAIEKTLKETAADHKLEAIEKSLKEVKLSDSDHAIVAFSTAPLVDHSSLVQNPNTADSALNDHLVDGTTNNTAPQHDMIQDEALEEVIKSVDAIKIAKNPTPPFHCQQNSDTVAFIITIGGVIESTIQIQKSPKETGIKLDFATEIQSYTLDLEFEHTFLQHEITVLPSNLCLLLIKKEAKIWNQLWVLGEEDKTNFSFASLSNLPSLIEPIVCFYSNFF
jgi:hypothetical protein